MINVQTPYGYLLKRDKISKNESKFKVVGRDKEIADLKIILDQGIKKNPLILAEPGVGKTAIVEGLASKLPLSGFADDIWVVDPNELPQDENFNLEFKKIIEFAEDHPELILFIDEIHAFIGSKVSNHAGSGNILKPALSRGDIRLIGATTTEEYSKYMQDDAALERRFVNIYISEPDEKNATIILTSQSKYLGNLHHVIYTKEAIKAALDLSSRYLPMKYLPDKGIDLLDRAGSKYKDGDNIVIIDETHIAKTLSEMTGIPVKKVLTKQLDIIQTFQKSLEKAVIGQNRAIDSVTNRVKVASTSLQNTNRPMGSFLFLGKPGVGKTYLATNMAKSLFGSKNDLIRFDMSEYSTADTGKVFQSNLAAAGKAHPYSIILFDEIEKAHPQIFDYLLQVLGEARLTDEYGRLVGFNNVYFVLTTNMAADLIEDQLAYTDYSKTMDKSFATQVDSELKIIFRPELVDRIDEKVVFNILDKTSINTIAKNSLKSLQKTLKQQGFKLTIKGSVVTWLVSNGYEKSGAGARPLNRVIENTLKPIIADAILKLQNQGFNKADLLLTTKGKAANKTDIFGSQELVIETSNEKTVLYD